LKSIQQIQKHSTFHITERHIRQGLAQVQKYSGLQSRLSIIQRKPFMIADVAHNPDAMSALTHALLALQVKRVILLFGLMEDKDYRLCIQYLIPITHHAYVVEAKTDRSRKSSDLAAEFERSGVTTDQFKNVRAGIRAAMKKAERFPILITGSHFVVGEVLAYLRKENYLTINQ
jgi:dihydrofolate synthase/folylpolyglutamate synthase